MKNDLETRRDRGLEIVREAAAVAHRYFKDIDSLYIEQKGRQDLVSDADKGVEILVRDALRDAFPDDGIIGEEYGRQESSSGYTWIIDPIDGTSSFVVGMPGWCVVLACVYQDVAVLGIVIDPIAAETYVAVKGQGATLNDKILAVSSSTSIADGSTAIGFSTRTATQPVLAVIRELMAEGGVYYRCGSGALMLCYVAAGRLIGYCEAHMNAWDCVAAMLIIDEAGGEVEQYDMQTMLDSGCRVITACPGVYEKLLSICESAYGG